MTTLHNAYIRVDEALRCRLLYATTLDRNAWLAKTRRIRHTATDQRVQCASSLLLWRDRIASTPPSRSDHDSSSIVSSVPWRRLSEVALYSCLFSDYMSGTSLSSPDMQSTMLAKHLQQTLESTDQGTTRTSPVHYCWRYLEPVLRLGSLSQAPSSDIGGTSCPYPRRSPPTIPAQVRCC